MHSFGKGFAAVLVVPALLMAASPSGATPPEPVYAPAVVDGNPGEWNLTTDFFSNMHRAGDPSKPLESKVYLRYDCSASVLYALVLGESGVPCDMIPGTAWIAIDGQNHKRVSDASGDDGIPPDFAWIGVGYDGVATHARGYEASFTLEPGSYVIITHVDVFDGGKTQTSGTPGFPGTGPALTIGCGPTPIAPTTWSRLKASYR